MGIGTGFPRALTVDRRVLRALVALLAVAILSGHLLCGCRPPANCDVGRDTWRCSPEGIPQHCDAHNRWRAWATVPCARVGGVCALRDGRATCVRISDAGAELPPNPYADAAVTAEGGL